MPESFSSGLRAVLDAAQDEAKRLSYGYVRTEHLLLGLIRKADGLVAEVFASLAIGLDGARAQVLNVTGRGIQPPESDSIPLTPLSRQILERAAGQARKFHASSIEQEHLLQALIMEISGETARVLTRLGSGPAAIRDRYVQLAGLGKSAARSIRVPPGPLFDRLTDGYRKVVNRAIAEAWMLHHDHVGTEHLLLALVGIDGEPAAETLRSLGVSLEAARRCVSEQSAQPSPGQLAPGQQRADLTGYTEHARKAMGSAPLEAMRRGDRYIGTEHLLLRLLDRDNTAVRVLAQLGCDPAAIRDLLRK
jgi:ATP-dependent Clp protease ATP-binding subunit ClpC